MGYLAYALETLKTKYVRLGGRASRKEFITLLLFSYLAIFVLLLSAFGLGFVTKEILGEKIAAATAWPVSIGFTLAILAFLPPLFAAFVRRLHDTGRSGWWSLISLLPFGTFVLLVFMLLESQPGFNKYGPNPLGIEGPATREVFL